MINGIRSSRLRLALRTALAAVALAGLVSSPASALTLSTEIDTALSSVSGLGPLSGSITLSLGALPPLAANTTFDVIGLVAQSGTLAFGLDPDLASPGLGVLRPDGSFLIPSLFLRLTELNGSFFDLTVLNVAGSFGASAACGGADCVETGFEVDTLGATGVQSITFVARVAEPTSLALLALLPLTACARRARGALR